MSTIERLTIQGIRSFGGNAGDAQVYIIIVVFIIYTQLQYATLFFFLLIILCLFLRIFVGNIKNMMLTINKITKNNRLYVLPHRLL